MNVSLRRAACPFVVLLGSATLLFAQAVQPGTTQPRVQPGTVLQRAQPGTATQPAQPGTVIQPGQPAQGGRFAQPGQPAQPGRIIGQPGQPGALGQIEPSIITLLIIDNNKEIALAQLGQQHSQNEDIKRFSQMIEKDHANFVQKLQEQAGGALRQRVGAIDGQPIREGAREAADRVREGAARTGDAVREGADQARETVRDAAAQTREAVRDAAGQAREAVREGAAQVRDAVTGQPREGATTQRDLTPQRDLQPGRTGQRITLAKPVIGNHPGAQILTLHQEVAEACLESARKDAEKARPEEFDKHFMAAQVLAHKGMLDKLQVFERHVSPRTAQLLASAQETTKKHLEEAESICKQLEQGGSDRGATIERRTERREGIERRPLDRPTDRPRDDQ